MPGASWSPGSVYASAHLGSESMEAIRSNSLNRVGEVGGGAGLLWEESHTVCTGWEGSISVLGAGSFLGPLNPASVMLTLSPDREAPADQRHLVCVHLGNTLGLLTGKWLIPQRCITLKFHFSVGDDPQKRHQSLHPSPPSSSYVLEWFPTTHSWSRISHTWEPPTSSRDC